MRRRGLKALLTYRLENTTLKIKSEEQKKQCMQRRKQMKKM